MAQDPSAFVHSFAAALNDPNINTYVNAKSFTCSETVVQELKYCMENILKTLSDKDVTANQAKDIAEKALLELDVFKKQLSAVCTALVTDVDHETGSSLATMLLSSTSDMQAKGDISITDDIGHLNRLVAKQRTENIKLKQVFKAALLVDGDASFSFANGSEELKQLQLEHDCAQEEIVGLKKKIDDLASQLNEKVMDLSNSEKEKELLKNNFLKEEELRKSLEIRQEQLDSEIVGLRDKISQFSKENENLRQRISEMKSFVNDFEQEKLVMQNQLNVKCELVGKLELEMREKDVLIENFSNSLKQKVEQVAQFEIKVQQNDNAIHELNEFFSLQSRNLNTLSTELYNIKDIMNELKSELQSKLDQEKKLYKEVSDLKILLREKRSVENLQNEMEGKLLFISNLQNVLKTKMDLIEQLENELQTAKAEASEMESICMEKEKIIDQLKSDLNENRNHLNNLQSSIKEKVKLVESLQKKMDGMRTAEVKSESDRKAILIEKLENDLTIKSSLLKDRNDELVKKTEFIKNMQQQLKEQCLMTEELKSEVLTRDASFENLKKEEHRSLEIIGALRKELHEKTMAIEKLELSMNDNKSILNKMETKLKQKNVIINRLEKDLERTSELTDKACLDSKQKSAEIRDLKNEVNIKDVMLKRFESDRQTETEHLQNKIIGLEKEIQSYKSQRSSNAHSTNSARRSCENSDFIPEISSAHYELKATGDDLSRDKSLEKEKGVVNLGHKNTNSIADSSIISKLFSKETTDSGTGKESAVSSDNGIPLSRTESQMSFPSSCEFRLPCDNNRHHQETGDHNNLSGSEKYANRVTVQLTLNYSPCLGIESDPNQDVPAPPPYQKEHHLSDNTGSSTSKKIHTGQSIQYSSAKEYMEGMSLSGTSPFVIGMLQDFELLKKEIQERMVQIKSTASRAASGLELMNKSSAPKKLLEQSTLKGIQDNCSCIGFCLDQAESLVNKFIIISWTMEEEYRYAGSLLVENQELKNQLTKLKRKYELCKKELRTTHDQFRREKRKREEEDRVLSKTMVETKEVLEKAKALLCQPATLGCSKS